MRFVSDIWQYPLAGRYSRLLKIRCDFSKSRTRGGRDAAKFLLLIDRPYCWSITMQLAAVLPAANYAHMGSEKFGTFTSAQRYSPGTEGARRKTPVPGFCASRKTLRVNCQKPSHLLNSLSDSAQTARGRIPENADRYSRCRE